MYQLLLVDDERSIVDSLSLTIPWEKVGVVNIFKAYSAYEALDILEENSIDIVITDIKMPGMSGIELLERINARWEHVKCVLLSGFDDFKYAQQAIKFGTSDYLLKPVKDEDLIETVKTIVKTLEVEWESITTYESAISTIKGNLPLLKSNLLTEILHDMNISQDTFIEKLNLLEIPTKYDDSIALLHIRINEILHNCKLESNSLIQSSIEKKAEQLLKEHFQIWSCIDERDYIVFVIKLSETINKEYDDIKLLREVGIAIQHDVKRYLGCKISVFLSQKGVFPNDLPNLYHESVSLTTSERLQNVLKEEQINDRFSVISEVHTFIEANLANDVSLQRIADHVYLHPVYLSKMYKLETGEGLSDFIYKLRMKKASTYLLNCNMKINVIAKTVGYQNTSYFIKMFKEFYGTTPQEFRNGKSTILNNNYKVGDL